MEHLGTPMVVPNCCLGSLIRRRLLLANLDRGSHLYLCYNILLVVLTLSIKKLGLKNRESMNCFNHDTAPAVGICKHCNKAICHVCLTDTGDGLACSSTCVADVHALNGLINRSRNTAPLTDRNAYLTPLFLAMIGTVSSFFGLLNLHKGGAFLLVFGVVFLVLAGLYFVRMRQWVSAAKSNEIDRPQDV